MQKSCSFIADVFSWYCAQPASHVSSCWANVPQQCHLQVWHSKELILCMIFPFVIGHLMCAALMTLSDDWVPRRRTVPNTSHVEWSYEYIGHGLKRWPSHRPHTAIVGSDPTRSIGVCVCLCVCVCLSVLVSHCARRAGPCDGLIPCSSCCTKCLTN